jgi:hypothetical protein
MRYERFMTKSGSCGFPWPPGLGKQLTEKVDELGAGVRPNYVIGANGQPVNPNLPSSQRSTLRYFNTAAFVQPINSFGDVGRNSMTGAGLVNLDTTVARTFRLIEKVRFEAGILTKAQIRRWRY